MFDLPQKRCSPKLASGKVLWLDHKSGGVKQLGVFKATSRTVGTNRQDLRRVERVICRLQQRAQVRTGPGNQHHQRQHHGSLPAL